MKADRPRSINPDYGQKGKFDDVVSVKDNHIEKLRANLDSKDEEFNDFNPTDLGFEVQPCWSTIQLKIIDDRISNKKSKGGIIVLENIDKLPYVWAEVLAVGPKVGLDADNGVRYETFNKGDKILCLETHISFIYLDDKPHSNYFQHDRPYIATIPDSKVVLRKVIK